MRRMPLVVAGLVGAALAGVGALVRARLESAAARASAELTADDVVSVPFRSGTDGYHTFRIPALLRTPA
uniref:sialidase family protein n=1 Tax=Desertihabitans aurantiacus TaxID=2282477 RepID=UPI0018E4F681